TALERRTRRRRLALGDPLVEHVRLQGVDDGEDELLRRARGASEHPFSRHYRRILSPAYFWSSRRPWPRMSRTKPGIARYANGGTKTAIAARMSAAPSA